jgi:hypothetical protein
MKRKFSGHDAGALAEHDYVIEAFATYRCDEPLRFCGKVLEAMIR